MSVLERFDCTRISKKPQKDKNDQEQQGDDWFPGRPSQNNVGYTSRNRNLIHKTAEHMMYDVFSLCFTDPNLFPSLIDVSLFSSHRKSLLFSLRLLHVCAVVFTHQNEPCSVFFRLLSTTFHHALITCCCIPSGVKLLSCITIGMHLNLARAT